MPEPRRPSSSPPLPVVSVPAASAPGTHAAAPGRGSRRYAVEGLCCATEVRQIEAKLGPHPGVTSLRFDPVGHTMDVVGPIRSGEVERAVASLGMKARPVDAPPVEASWWERRGRLVLAVVSGALWLASMAAGAWIQAGAAAVALSVGAVVAGGWHVFPGGCAPRPAGRWT